MINPMDFPCIDLVRSPVLASLALALAACAPKESDSQDGTGTPQQTITDDSSAGPGTSGTGSTTESRTTSTETGQTTATGCDAVECIPCYVLSQEDCSCCTEGEDVPPCWPYHGTRLDREQDCVEEDVYAVCGNSACAGWGVTYQAPDGTCWFFTSDCLGEGTDAPGWTLDLDGELCPEFFSTEPLPPC
jgi:hypothetical protein